MGENKGQTIFLSVIGIATLLVAIIGATFAYFTSTSGTGTGNVDLTAKTVAGFTATAGSITSDETILPGWSKSADISVATTDKTDVPYEYSCVLSVDATTTLTDMFVSVAAATTNAAPAGDIKAGTNTELQAGKEVTLLAGTVGNTTGAETKAATYTIKFKETGAAQANQGANFKATVTCKSTLSGGTDGVFYTNDAKTGTTSKPDAQW